MNNVTVDRATLERILSYVIANEAEDYEDCEREEWTPEELKNHVYHLAQDLANKIDLNK
jgi:N-acetylglutamate synthase/N-acetylornithine aminotransferase